MAGIGGATLTEPSIDASGVSPASYVEETLIGDQ
jgi:hypothetical protein